MVDWLIIAEKNSQAKKIASILFDKKKGNGSFQNGGFGGQQVSSILDGEVRIVHFKGHIYEMEMPNNQSSEYSLSTETKTNKFGMTFGGESKEPEEVLNNYPIELNLNKIKWKLSKSEHKQISNNMKKLYKDAKNIVVATDFDNEGEMIFRNWQNLNISRPKWDQMFRAKFNALTDKDILHAFNNLIPYKNNPKELSEMYAKGFARSIADYEYGLSFTFYGWCLSKKYNVKKGQYGRLKNALLGVVYNQEIAHDEFVPSSQYRIDMVLPNGEILQGDESYIFKTEEAAKRYIDKNTLPNKIDLDFKETEKKQLPPKLFSRNELLVKLMKEFKKELKGNDTWNTYLQSLYEEHTLLSYPRTDIQYISEDIYEGLKELIKTNAVQHLLNTEIEKNIKKFNVTNDIKIDVNKPSSKRYVDESKLEGESHYALIPTTKEPTNYSELSPLEQIVYRTDLIHTMAIFCNPALVRNREYKAIENFSSKQTKTVQYGYKLLVGSISENKDKFPEKGNYDVTYKVSEVKAKRPSLFTEVSLLNMTKRVNWGTSSTRDATITNLLEKQSLIKDKEYLRINPDLKSTIKLLLNKDLINFEMTSDWQTQLDKLTNYNDALEFINTTREDTKLVHETFDNILSS